MINRLADRKMRRQSLVITLFALIAVAILWNIRELEFLVYLDFIHMIDEKQCVE